MGNYDRNLQNEIRAELKVVPSISVHEEIERRVSFLKRFLVKNGLNGFVLGLSGGQDSTLAGKLAQLAVSAENKKFVAMRIPYGIQKDATDVDMAVNFINPDVIYEFNIKQTVDVLCKTFEDITGEAMSDFNKGNVKARMRMVVQYAVAAKENMAVIGTDHASENLMGFFTKHGDGAADILPLYGLTKFQGREILQALHCPERLYLKTPTADLLDHNPLRPDEDELGISYEAIEAFLVGGFVKPKDYDGIIKQYFKTSHKRNLPVTIYDFVE